MGFGILFIGYFFILNFAYCNYTDALAAVLILYALAKLSKINSNFSLASKISVGFTAFALFELGVAAWDMFSPISAGSPIFTVCALLRHLILAFLCFTMLLGIRDVACEVKLPQLETRSAKGAYVTVVIYALNILLESAALANFLEAKTLALLSVFVVLATLGVTCINLVTVYTAYMRICMPGEENMPERESKFAFVNAFRRHEEEKQREYAEYKLEKLKNSQKKKEGKKK